MKLDILATFETEPEVLDFVLPGFVAGTVGTLFAAGATGKSFFALEAAMTVACAGGDLLGFAPPKHGDVAIFSAEDPAIILRQRLHTLGTYLSPCVRAQIAEALMIVTPYGESTWDVVTDGGFKNIADGGMGKRLIILDTISRLHSLDENSNREMVIVLGRLEKIADVTGAAVLFLHHVSKSAAGGADGGGQHSARGASVLTDNSRWGAALTKMNPKELAQFQCGKGVKFQVPKNNYSAPLNDLYFKQGVGGVLMPVSAATSNCEKQGISNAGFLSEIGVRKDDEKW